MILRRLILTILILAILPTTVDPSCVRYFIYSNAGFGALLCEEEQPCGNDGAVCDRTMEESNRPTEVLAATRVPSQVSIEPIAVLDLWSGLVAALIVRHRTDAEHAPPFLASTQRSTFLRNSVLLI